MHFALLSSTKIVWSDINVRQYITFDKVPSALL